MTNKLGCLLAYLIEVGLLTVLVGMIYSQTISFFGLNIYSRETSLTELLTGKEEDILK